MKITIYTGTTTEPKKCLFDDLHPKFQIFNFRQLIEQNCNLGKGDYITSIFIKNF